MAKPIGPKCNLDCRYCYYLEKERLYPSARGFRMSERVLEAFIRHSIEAQEGPEVWFNWQGGEPTLLGLGFFEKVVELERRYCPQGKTIYNALQTNGTLLDERWAAFFKAHGFLVGLSIDGPRRLHDRYRVGRKGRPTFDAVHRALGLLRDEGVEFNTLSVVHRANAKEGRRVYRFLRDEGVRFMQFIALVERIEADGSLAGPPSADDGRPGPAVAPWCAPAKGYGDFMCAVFDEWVRADVGSVFVQLFDVELELWSGLRSTLCVFAETCGRALALEHNGDLYACDHYVYPGFRLGNLGDSPLATFARSAEQVRFGEAKRDALPRYCRTCEFLFACNGGCPKHRFARTPDGEPGLNYLCPSYKRYFAHTAPYMRVMAELLRSGRPPALITRMLRDQAPGTPPKPAAKVGRNEPCPCGSGRKFKRCCGAFLETSV